MDTVPYIFIDRVVELFDSPTLTSSLASRLKKGTWRSVIRLHRRNRHYYNLEVRLRDSNVDCFVYFYTYDDDEVEDGRNLSYQYITHVADLDRRFSRIREIAVCSDTESRTPLLTFRQDEMEKVLKFMFPFYVYGNANHYSLFEPLIETQFLECAFGKMYFTILALDYSAEAENILKEHIDNFPYLHVVHLGESWPDTILPHMKKYVFQKEKSLTARFGLLMLSGDEIEEIVEFWKENYEYQFTLSYIPHPDDEQRFFHQMIPYISEEHDEEDDEIGYEKGTHYLLNVQRKHVVVHLIADDEKSTVLEFMRCCCATDEEKCEIKEMYPKFHRF
ncbi:hypothetical protein QR680_014305 [Steinernema hermaphroditum]|uniref:Uncharacterized protein n=1 Tax=Steinernema hermaphroditum TaxID=289476 RepID=A0AA39I8F6_9BILA|nr:hypothetical protein QR680_014305 [Steinernema hermaphroditum]